MRRTVAALSIAVMLGLGLSACTPSGPGPTVTVTAPAEPQTPVTPETPTQPQGTQTEAEADAYFLDLLKDDPLTQQDPQGSKDLAIAVCDALDRGVTVDEIVTAELEGVTDPDEARSYGRITFAGIVSYCPQYTQQGQDWLDSQSNTA
jgi:hypothetical protein